MGPAEREPLVEQRALRAVLDNWQLSGENAFVSGDWSPVFLATTDNFDFTGGDGGAGNEHRAAQRRRRPRRQAPDRRRRDGGQPERRTRPAGIAGSTVDAFGRPTGRGDFGDAPRTVFQLPGINNWNISLFKNFPMGGSRRLQFRWEIYNLLNHTQFSTLDNTARFDALGAQVNPAFGKATAARNPRIMQGAIRFTF